MTTLAELAVICRSKNAGPFQLTLDIVLRDHATWRRVVESGAVTAASIGALYHVAEEDVLLTLYESANAIKATLPRHGSAGDVGDGDVYGAQQHAPLLTIEIPGD